MEPINAHFAQLFKIRSYQHLFSISRKSSPKSSSANSVANSSRPEPEAAVPEKYQITTIKEVAKAKLISKEVIISTEELPQEALHKPFLDINSHNTSVDINNLALSMQKSPENIDKAIELSTKCIEHLKNRLEKFQSVPRSKRIYIDEKETSERPFSRAFSIEVTPLSPTERRRTKSRDAILTNPPRLNLQNYQSTFRVSIDELKRTSPKIKIESLLLNKENNREIITPIKPAQETPLDIKTSELKTLPSNHSPADEIGILNSYKSEKSIASLPSQFSVHEPLKTVPNPCQILKNLPLKSHMETCDTHDTHDNTYDFSTKIPSRVSLHDIPDLSSSCVLKANNNNNNTSNSRICMTSTKDSITRSTSARNSAKGPNPLQRDMNIEVTPKTGNKNGYINLAQICAATSQTNRGNPLTKPLRADHLFKTPTPNEENSYPSLWQNQDQTLRSSFTQAVSEVQQASTKRANSTQENEKKPYVSPYTVTFKAKELQNQKVTSRSVTKKPQVQNRAVSKEDLNASINSKRTSRSGSIQASKVNKSMVMNTSTASRKSSKDVITKRNPHVESPKGRRTPANVPTLESNQSSQEFTRLGDFDLEAVKRDIMNGSVENVIKVLSAKKTAPAAPTQERRSKWKIPSEDLPLQSVSSRKGLKEQDTNKSSVSSSTYNKIKNSMRSDSPVICLNLERTQNNESSFVSSSETEQPKLKLLLNSQSMSRASIGNNSHLDIESVIDKKLRMSDLESSPAIRNLTKQKENSNPRKPSVTKANNRVNQSMDYLRPTISSNQKKPVPGIKHITPVKKVSTVAVNNSFQQGTPKDSDILTITSIASSQKSKSPQSKISCKFVNSIQIGHADHQNTSHPNMKFEYADTVRSSFGSQSNFNQTKTEHKVLSQFAKYSSFEIQRQVFTEPAAPEEEEEESPRLLTTYGIQSHFGVNHEQNEDYEDITSPQTPKKEKEMFSFQNQSALKRANELDSVRSSKPEFNDMKNLPSDRKKSPCRVTTSLSSKVEFDVFKRLSDPGYQTFEALRNQNYDTKNTEPQEPITEKYEEEKEYRLDTQEFEDFVEQLQVRAQNMQSKYETLIIDESQEVGDIKPISFDLKAHTLTEKPHGSTSRSRRSSKEDEPSSDLQLETQSVTEPEIPKDSYQSVRIRTTEETHPRITEPDSPVFNIKENSKRLSLQSQQTSQRSHDDLLMKRRSFAQPVVVPTVTSLHETVKDLHCPPQSKAGVSTKAHSFASQGGNTSNSLRETGSVPVSLTSLLDQTSKNNFKANIDKLFQEPKVIPSKQFIHKAPSKQISVNDKKGFPRTPLMYKEQSSARVYTVDLGDSSLKVNATLSKSNRSMASYSNEQNQQEESSVLIDRNCNIGPKFMDKENLFKEKRIVEDDEISDDDDDIPEERPNQTTNGTTEGKYYTDERFMTGSDKFSNEKKFSFENGALYTDNTLGDEVLKTR